MKLTGRWFPQIVDRDSGNLYPIYIKQKLWCKLLNLLAGDLGRPSCLVVSYSARCIPDRVNILNFYRLLINMIIIIQALYVLQMI